MYDNEFFVVDMASCSSTGEIINNLSLALETLNHSGKKIVLKLNDNYFNQSQMLSIQSLITSYGCILDTVETINEETIKVVENMNILVQKPIEKRVEEKYSNSTDDNNFQYFSVGGAVNADEIALKDVTGLHFEADLDIIQQQQESINIKSDLQKVGISPRADFEEIENQALSQFDSLKQTLEAKDEIQSSIVVQTAVEEDFNKNQPSEFKNAEFENTEKNSIGVYKKAYDENSIEQDEWEEVDFYETSQNEANEPLVSDSKQTTYINQTLRSGQILESDGNVVIIGDCHPGSEIRAVGDITVWGVLSGIAHAGCKGNNQAKVRALKMNAIQLRIGNCYSRRPDDTNIPYIIKSSIFTPEEARIVDDEIMLFKINQN